MSGTLRALLGGVVVLLGTISSAAGFPGTDASLPALDGHSALARPLAAVARGLTLLRAGDYAEAAGELALARGTQIDDLAIFHEAEAHFHLGRYDRARDLYRAVLSWRPASDWRHRAHFRLGDCSAGLGKGDEALEAWARALSAYPEYPMRAALRFAMARVEVERGRLERGAARYRELRQLDPGDPLSRQAGEELAKLEARGVKALHPTPAQRLAHAVELRKRKYYAEAIVALDAMRRETDVPPEIAADVEWNIARSLWESEKFEPALAAFQKIRDTTKVAGTKRRATRWVGYSLERLGRLDEAAAALAQASGRADRPPGEVVLDIAWLYFNNGAYAKAETWFKRAPGNAKGMRFMGAWLAYRRGDLKRAATLFVALARASRTAPERFRYWEARCREQAGQKDAARDLYRAVSVGSPIGYYGYQALARLAEAGGIAGVEAVPAPVAEAAAAPGPVSGAGGASEPGVVVPGPPPSTAALATLARGWGDLFPAAVQALELVAVGERRLAALRIRTISDEWRAFRQHPPGRRAAARWSYSPRPYLDNRKDAKTGEWGRALGDAPPARDARRGPALAAGLPEAFRDALAQAFIDLDDPHYARRHLRDGQKLRAPPESPENRAAWARRFPRAYADILTPKARHYRVDPSLLWAFMTVESSYNPFAISRANARGLMQVMPQTGGLIADRMALRGFGAALLFEPEVTLEMAAWYVRALLDKFNGQFPLAIAAYNAGPHRVAAWLGRKGGLPMDEFIEEIPYDEAREYTKKVLRFWGLYRRLYDGQPGLAVDLGQRVDARFKDNINF